MLTEVEGAKPGGSLEVPIALAEVEGAEPGGGYGRRRSGDIVERPQ